MAVPRQRRRTIVPQEVESPQPAEPVSIPIVESPQAPASPSLSAIEPHLSETAPTVAEPPKAGEPSRPLLADPFTFKTVNLGGYKIHFQHSRQAGEFQIRFGDGSRDDMPPETIRDFIKSHKVQASDGSAEKNLFHWNENDRAWGMRIPVERNATDEEHAAARENARLTAKPIFDEVVRRVVADRGTGPAAGL